MDLQALKTEITTDPETLGYTSDDVQCAELLSAPGREVDRETLSSGDLVASIVAAEYTALLPAAKEYISLIAACESVPLTPTLKQQLGAMFPGNSTTRANLMALLKRTGSRAEELGLGRVTESDVARARRE